ncbi:MAG: DUF4129 domain-containing protein [Prevotella sp.]|nr:DUF4129 domain-containing protein [Prevotella sp.]
MHADTLQTDQQLLEQLQQDPRYAYAIEEQKPSLLDEFIDWIGEQLSEHLDANISFYRPVFYSLCTLAVIILVWWLVRSGVLQRLLAILLKEDVSIEEAEENIHVIDFEAEIARARTAGDYTRASRLLYLQTLKQLSDAHRIDWQPQKTPAQYTREVSGMAFLQLTNHFVRIRYGGFEADEQLFLTMEALQAEIKKGGDA